METLIVASQSWNNAPLPGYPEGTPELTILKATIPPNSSLHMHTHPVINAGYLLTGELTVITEDRDTLHLKAGEPLIEVVNTWHYGINNGRKHAEIIVFYAGAEGIPVTILKEDN